MSNSLLRATSAFGLLCLLALAGPASAQGGRGGGGGGGARGGHAGSHGNAQAGHRGGAHHANGQRANGGQHASGNRANGNVSRNANGNYHANGNRSANVNRNANVNVNRNVNVNARGVGYWGRPAIAGPRYAWPRGYAYVRRPIGYIMPRPFLAATYYYTAWATLGLAAPPANYQWVRYGPDLFLVDTLTGRVTDVRYGVFAG